MSTFKTIQSADDQLHAFSTFAGLPPDSDTPPVCGAMLTSAYNGRGKKECRMCRRILRQEQQRAQRRMRRTLPKTKTTPAGITLYLTFNRDGKPIYVSIPAREND